MINGKCSDFWCMNRLQCTLSRRTATTQGTNMLQCTCRSLQSYEYEYSLHSVSRVNLVVAFLAKSGKALASLVTSGSHRWRLAGRQSISLLSAPRVHPSPFFIAWFLYSIDYSFAEAEAAFPANAQHSLKLSSSAFVLCDISAVYCSDS